ncbi:MAG: lytic transglycosylase domain-containing protein [Bacteroidales bacterium]|nr:lytic transglycosylase domain-containing protein [Bacteroidales bacterium]
MNKTIWIPFGLLAFFLFNVFLFQAFSEKETTPDDAAKPFAREQIQPVYNVEIPETIAFCGEVAPLDMFLVREYFDRELTSNTYFHSSTMMLIKRSYRWFPIIEPILSQHKIPNDFKYLALIESGLENPVSPAGAAGVWQFMTTTAREYGLEVNDGIDERYHLEKATHAACNYLKDAYAIYGNWTLVAAAYNTGNNRISKSLSEQQVDNYYDLFLNQETARYIFRILAIKTIFENPENYGFYMDKKDLFPPIPVRVVEVTQTIPSLVDFARSHHVTYKVLKYFNPWLRQESLPNSSKRTYQIKIPLEGYTNYSKLWESEQ